MKNFIDAIFTRKAKQKNDSCSICQTYTQKDYNYCMRCGSRFIGFFKHMSIYMKYHMLKG